MDRMIDCIERVTSIPSSFLPPSLSPSLPPSLPLSHPLSTDALDKRCEDLQFHNHTLLDDKKQLQETLDTMKGVGGNDAGSGGGLEREIEALQNSLHQKVYIVHVRMHVVCSQTTEPYIGGLLARAPAM